MTECLAQHSGPKVPSVPGPELLGLVPVHQLTEDGVDSVAQAFLVEVFGPGLLIRFGTNFKTRTSGQLAEFEVLGLNDIVSPLL